VNLGEVANERKVLALFLRVPVQRHASIVSTEPTFPPG
jgi:hypothetical protein